MAEREGTYTTIPIERIYSLKNVKIFLQSLIDPKQTPRVPRYIRVEARGYLKHFPGGYETECLEKKCKCGVFKLD